MRRVMVKHNALRREVRTEAMRELMKNTERTNLANGHKLTKVERAECIRYMLGLIKDGKTYMERMDAFQEHFNASPRQARDWEKEAMTAITEWQGKDIGSIRSMQTVRLEGILSEALSSNDRKTALHCIDIINKMYGVYQSKPEVVVAPVMQFKFGNDSIEPSIIISQNNDTE